MNVLVIMFYILFWESCKNMTLPEGSVPEFSFRGTGIYKALMDIRYTYTVRLHNVGIYSHWDINFFYLCTCCKVVTSTFSKRSS